MRKVICPVTIGLIVGIAAVLGVFAGRAVLQTSYEYVGYPYPVSLPKFPNSRDWINLIVFPLSLALLILGYRTNALRIRVAIALCEQKRIELSVFVRLLKLAGLYFVTAASFATATLTGFYLIQRLLLSR